MKKYRILALLAVLVLASLACQALTGGGDGEDLSPLTSDDNEPSASPSDTDTGNTSDGGGS